MEEIVIEKQRVLQINHFSHHHPLAIYNVTDKVREKLGSLLCTCNGCTNIVLEGEGYWCEECRFFLHKSCAELPEMLHSPFHMEHPLTLHAKPPYPKRTFTCIVCDKIGSGFTYHCNICTQREFDMHPAYCSSKQPHQIDDPERKRKWEKQHLAHDHPLIPCIVTDKHNFNCQGCGLQVLGMAYHCSKGCLSYYLHKTCFEMTREKQHPFHPQHPLTLLTKSPYNEPRNPWCKACLKRIKGYIYHCPECKFELDLTCASIIPTLKHEGHEHPLAFFKEIQGIARCKACNGQFSTNMYRCVQCDRFQLHSRCALLPSTVNLDYHMHPLILVQSHKEEDSDELRCDACETVRNPDSGVYVCKKCNFVVHIECAVPQEYHTRHVLLTSSAAKIEAHESGSSEGNEVISTTTNSFSTGTGEKTEAAISGDVINIGIDCKEIKELRREVETLTMKVVSLTMELGVVTAKLTALESKHNGNATPDNAKLE